MMIFRELLLKYETLNFMLYCPPELGWGKGRHRDKETLFKQFALFKDKNMWGSSLKVINNLLFD